MSITCWGSPVNLMAMPAPPKPSDFLQPQIVLAQQVAPLRGAAICSPTTWGLFSNTAVSVGNPLLKRSEEHTSELQSRGHLVCRLLLEKKNKIIYLHRV